MPAAFSGLCLGGKNACNSRALPEHCSLVSKGQCRLKSLGGFLLTSVNFTLNFLNLGISSCTIQDTRSFSLQMGKVKGSKASNFIILLC